MVAVSSLKFYSSAVQAPLDCCFSAPFLLVNSPMELTFSSIASISCQRSSKPVAESLLSKRENFLKWDYHVLSFPLIKRSTQFLFVETQGSIRRRNCLKILCAEKREIPVVEARSMNEIYDALAERLIPTAAAASNPNLKHIVGLAGPPGAGKSTVAAEVVRRVNKLWPQKVSSVDSLVEPPDVAAVLPMDGFHLYRSQLDEMENPSEAHSRRGVGDSAPWTFDPNLLYTRLKTLRNQGFVYVPSFDHGVGDPVQDDIFVGLQHKVVIVEGNYLLLEDGVWKEISSSFDEKWFIDIDIDIAMERVLRRHISTGKSSDVAKWRVRFVIDYNDRPNAELILKSKKNSDLIISERLELEIAE